MGTPKEGNEARPFSIAFSAVLKGIMSENGISQVAVADALSRNQSYVSERVSGKRAFTTDEVDAVAQLMNTTGRALLLLAAQRLQETKPARHLTALPPLDSDYLHNVELDRDELAASHDDGSVGPERGDA